MQVEDVWFDKGEVLYNEGDKLEVVLFIESGEIEFYRQRGDRKIFVQKVSRGFFAGEIGFLENKAQPMSARALSDVHCVAVRSSQLDGELSKISPLVRALLINLTRKLRHVTDTTYGRVERSEDRVKL